MTLHLLYCLVAVATTITNAYITEIPMSPLKKITTIGSSKRKQSTLFSYLENPNDAKKDKKNHEHKDKIAQALSRHFNSEVCNLTENGKSWYILCKSWLPSKPKEFEIEWNLHPNTRHSLKVYGRICQEKRWSQAWGVSYPYSGSIAIARPIHESYMLLTLMQKINALMNQLELTGKDSKPSTYNGCLQNWYGTSDVIGLHSDDERTMDRKYPIFSLSWGGTRRFLFRSKDPNDKSITELYLENGDLLIMGGTSQETHKHEVPKVRITKDPISSDRINWTIRSFCEK